ncbi:hypothetical protein HN604_03610 [archaeon]|nr:hypothetical protein [archaeon]
MGKKIRDAVVKIDSSLLLEVEEFIRKKSHRYKYVNRKQFIDIAVNEFLQKELQKSALNGRKKVKYGK